MRSTSLQPDDRPPAWRLIVKAPTIEQLKGMAENFDRCAAQWDRWAAILDQSADNPGSYSRGAATYRRLADQCRHEIDDRQRPA